MHVNRISGGTAYNTFDSENNNSSRELFVSSADIDDEKKVDFNQDVDLIIEPAQPNNNPIVGNSLSDLLIDNTNNLVDMVNNDQSSTLADFCVVVINYFTGSLHISNPKNILLKVAFALSVYIYIIKSFVQHFCRPDTNQINSYIVSIAMSILMETLSCAAVLNSNNTEDKELFLILLLFVQIIEPIVNNCINQNQPN